MSPAGKSVAQDFRLSYGGGMTNAAAPLALSALLMLGACTKERTDAPSLAHRPVESRGFDEPAAPPPQSVRVDPVLDRAIADWTATLRTIATGFDRDAARATAAVTRARGAAVGSEAWITAQTELATLDDWRAQATAVASDVEIRAGDSAATLAPPYPALTRLQQAAGAEVERQDALIRRLTASIAAA